MHIRNKQDKLIFSEASRCYGWMNMKDKVVMDIGLNIGAFTRLALDRGAKKVVAFEPEVENFELAKLNCPDENAELLNTAIISGEEQEISLYTTKNRVNCGNFSTQFFRGRDEVKVVARNFKKELHRIMPEILKIDCEGAEYDFLTEPLPEFVQEVTIEIHLSKREWRNTKAFQLVALFNDWEFVKSPKIGEKNWHTIGGFRRKQS